MDSKQTLPVAIFLLFCCAGICIATPYTDCGSTGAKITEVTVAGCDTLPCQLKRGTNVSFTMDFTPSADIDAATVQVYAFLGPIKVPFSPQDNNACHFTTCPLKSGVPATYKQSLPVLASYPALSVTVEWELVNAGKILTCFRISAQLS